MSDHTHSKYIAGCFRCDLSRDEVEHGYVTEEMVEQAAAAAFERAFMRHAPDDLDMPYSSLGDPIQESWRVVARESLSAVVPGIVQAAKVEALREAARSYQWGGWASHPQTEVDLVSKRRQAEHAVAWLRARADQIEAGR